MFRRPGMTLVELLVVIAIIAILIALLLPAVNSVRESARRTQCLNNMRQVGMSLINYESARRKLPPGSLTTEGLAWGYAAHILPFMEEQAVYESIDFSVKRAGSFLIRYSSPGESMPARTLFRC